MRHLAALVILAAAGSALHAAPVTWYLEQVTFSDGGRAVGSFVYDSTTRTFSSVNVQTTPGAGTPTAASPIAGGNYTGVVPQDPPPPGVPAPPPPVVFISGAIGQANTRRVALLDPNTLTDGGGAVPLTRGSIESLCDVGCTGPLATAVTRTIVGGSLVALPPANPRTWYLTGTFDDGGQALGSFVFDAATGTFSDIDISTTRGTSFATGARIQLALPTSTAAAVRFVSKLPPDAEARLISLAPPAPLANADAVAALGLGAGETTCTAAGCANVGPVHRIFTSGTLSTTPPAGYIRIMAQIADGSGWQTGLLIANLRDAPATYALTFARDDGNPFPVPGIGAHVAATVPAGGVSFLNSSGAGSLTQGWARLEGAHNFSVTAIFTSRNANAGGDQQGSVPGDSQGTTSISIPFDNIGASVGLAIANPGPSAVTILAVAYDETGAILMRDASISLPARGHTAFTFADRAGYSVLRNRRGLIRLFALHGATPPYLGINALLLKFLPNGSFTTIGVANQ